MSIEDGTGDNATIINNTFNLFGKGDAYEYHMANAVPSGMQFRNNLLIRCSGLNVEISTPVPALFDYIDYNLYASVMTRYTKVVVAGKNAGDPGFDGHAQAVNDPAAVVQNPAFGYPFPFNDDEIFNGTVRVSDVLDAYRSAYAPKTGSPAVDNGDPQDAATVTDGKCDIGAVELSGANPPDEFPPSKPNGLTATATGPTTVTLSWTKSTDNVRVLRYWIDRNGVRIGSSPGTSHTDAAASPNTHYAYSVAAFDGTNTGEWSDPATVVTPVAAPGVYAPNAPRSLRTNFK
jgi:hypothetical protein